MYVHRVGILGLTDTGNACTYDIEAAFLEPAKTA
jgi:hypothetical protein